MTHEIEIWPEAEIRLKDLKDFDKNPRRISKTRFEELVKSIREDGYHSRIMVNLDNRTVGGHQRKKALKALGFKDNDLIKVLVPLKLLTEEEFKRANFRHNLNYGEYDKDILANEYELSDLMDWGAPEEMFPSMDQIDIKEEKEVIVGGNKTTCPECGHRF